MFVEFRQALGIRDDWLPFLVTHVEDVRELVISGVGFSGWPIDIGWNDKGTQSFSNVQHGFGSHQWRFVGETNPEETESAESE